ncbi:MAG: hypothetical protein KDC69_01470 [Flavobacteriaceae bacterium]|nr:hypothetical protein [Flavobacteriaceae bacterium]
MDFTLKKYRKLVETLKRNNYNFQTFEEFIKSPKDRTVILRHDVDRRAINATWLAQIEHELGVKGSYYFRIVPESNNPEVIRKVAGFGHEIGYHYEDLGAAKGNYELAYKNYLENLKYFRNYYPVSTICMHGSPENKIDNRSIWKKYSYKEDGIIAEPYFDVNYNEVFYLTDTGRAWNKKSVIVRDKVETNFEIKTKNIEHIMKLIEKGELPDKMIISTHPHRWFNVGLLWTKELILQNIKNVVKSVLIKLNVYER